MNRDKKISKKRSLAIGIVSALCAFSASAQEPEAKTEDGITPSDQNDVVTLQPSEDEALTPLPLSDYYIPQDAQNFDLNDTLQDGQTWRLSDADKRIIEQQVINGQNSYPNTYGPDQRPDFNAEFQDGCNLEDRFRGNLFNFSEGRNYRFGVAPDEERLLSFEFRWGGSPDRDPFEDDRRCRKSTGRFSGSILEGFDVGRGSFSGPNREPD